MLANIVLPGQLHEEVHDAEVGVAHRDPAGVVVVQAVAQIARLEAPHAERQVRASSRTGRAVRHDAEERDVRLAPLVGLPREHDRVVVACAGDGAGLVRERNVVRRVTIRAGAAGGERERERREGERMFHAGRREPEVRPRGKRCRASGRRLRTTGALDADDELGKDQRQEKERDPPGGIDRGVRIAERAARCRGEMARGRRSISAAMGAATRVCALPARTTR